MAAPHKARLSKLVDRTQRHLERFADLTRIKIWHAECLSVLRELYSDSSPIVADWRSISLDWGMVYHGEWVDETFLKNLDEEDQGYHSHDYEKYANFCRGRLEDMKEALLEYISLPPEVRAEDAQAKALFRIPDLGFIDDQKLRKMVVV